MGDIINKPTKMRAGVVAAPGTIRNNGEKNMDKKKSPATTKAVSPVRPPADTPVALSTKVVTVLEPRHAPEVVAIASANSACLQLGTSPFSLSILALVDTPTNVPTVSKHINKQKSEENNCHISCEHLIPLKLKKNGRQIRGHKTITKIRH